MEAPLDSRYVDEAPPPPYQDQGSRDNAKLFAYQYERQKLCANKTQAPPIQHAGASAPGSTPKCERAQEKKPAPKTLPEPASLQNRVSSNLADLGIESLPLAKNNALNLQQNQLLLNATCANCLSSDSMCMRDEGIFCCSCNRAALIPRVSNVSS